MLYLGLFTFLSNLVLECRLFEVTTTDKCRLMFFIAKFLKLMGKTREAEGLFLRVENMLMQVQREITLNPSSAIAFMSDIFRCHLPLFLYRFTHKGRN